MYLNVKATMNGLTGEPVGGGSTLDAGSAVDVGIITADGYVGFGDEHRIYETDDGFNKRLKISKFVNGVAVDTTDPLALQTTADDTATQLTDLDDQFTTFVSSASDHISGPAVADDNSIVVWDGTSGKAVKGASIANKINVNTDLDMTGYQIADLGPPIGAEDAATKGYVDSQSHQSAPATTTSNSLVLWNSSDGSALKDSTVTFDGNCLCMPPGTRFETKDIASSSTSEQISVKADLSAGLKPGTGTRASLGTGADPFATSYIEQGYFSNRVQTDRLIANDNVALQVFHPLKAVTSAAQNITDPKHYTTKAYVDTTLLPGAQKVNLNTTLPEFSGSTVTYQVKSGVGILEGQPVFAQFTDFGLTEATTSAAGITDPATPQLYLGIAVRVERSLLPTSPDFVKILTDGYTTCRYSSDSFDNMYPDRTFRYTDSGDSTADYDNNNSSTENIFDAGVGGTWDLKISANGYQFERIGSTIYDYLQLQVTNSVNGLGIPDNWADANISYFFDSIDTTSRSTGGSFFPDDRDTLTITNGYTADSSIPLSFRYIKFVFTSDGGTTRAGWSIQLRSTNSPAGTAPALADVKMNKSTNDAALFVVSDGSAVPLTLGTELFVDTSAYDKLTTVFSPAQTNSVGLVAAANGDNDSVFAWVRTAWRDNRGL